MTIEEAGQIILEGKPFLQCSTCSGTGFTEKGEIQIGDSITIRSHDGAYIAMRRCTACDAHGIYLNFEYIEACQKLDIKLPNTRDEVGEVWGKGDMFKRQSLGTVVSIKGVDIEIRSKVSSQGLYRVNYRHLP